MEWAAVTDRGLHREKNEDAYLALPERGLFAVADGLGGHLAGEVASRVALESFAAAVGCWGESDPATALTCAAAAANEAVYRLAQTNLAYKEMGTTLTACIFKERELFWVHVGDSRGYLVRKGEITQFTRDHSLFTEFLREGHRPVGEGWAYPGRNVLTRAIGVEPTVAVDTGRLSLVADDAVLLCTDGLTLHLDEVDILRVISRGVVARQAEELVQLALERGGRDNVTVILIKM
ncbi:Stp1/IreP family PP2C-type Ser/Thr phosphatase [Thermodesulfitimonas sp.]